MKKLMILGAGVYQLPLVEYASGKYEIILVAPFISDEFSVLVKKCYICDVTSMDRILEIATEENIDGIITDQTDIAVRTVAYVAEKLNLPGIGYETAKLFTDKQLMRERCMEIGVKTLPYIIADSVDDVIRFYKQIDGSIILKPQNNQGSRGVVEIDCYEDILEKYTEAMQYSRTGQIIAEKMARGREFVVEGLCFNYQYMTLIYGDTDYFDIKDAFAAKTRIFPSSCSSDIAEKLLELNRTIITGFGLKQGITHSEYIMDGEEIYLIETAARGGGVFISSDLIHLGSGLETEQFLTDIALGLQKEMPPTVKKQRVCGYLAFFLPRGRIVSVDGVETVRKLPFVHRNLLNTIHVGDRIEFHYDKTARYSIILEAPNMDVLYERIGQIKSTLNIQVENDGMVEGIIWE